MIGFVLVFGIPTFATLDVLWFMGACCAVIFGLLLGFEFAGFGSCIGFTVFWVSGYLLVSGGLVFAFCLLCAGSGFRVLVFLCLAGYFC